jgi:phosphatidylserine decarboxylase
VALAQPAAAPAVAFNSEWTPARAIRLGEAMANFSKM